MTIKEKEIHFQQFPLEIQNTDNKNYDNILESNIEDPNNPEKLKDIHPISFSIYKTKGQKKEFYELGPVYDSEGEEGSSVKSDCDARYLFLDSSIWYRYVNKDIPGKLDALKAEITKYEKLELYQLKSAYEYRDFQLRLFENSYIKHFGKEKLGDHAEVVTPFSFHSETQIQIQTNSLVQNLKNKIPNNSTPMNWEWNILLFDDHAKSKLTKIDGEDANFSKGDILYEALDLQHKSSINSYPQEKETGDIIMDFGENSITFTLNFFKEESFEKGADILHKVINNEAEVFYDVVLLDYLFYKKVNGVIETHQFSDDIIIQLLKDNVRKTGPLGKLWFFPISVYQNALTDKLRNAGIPYYGGQAIFSEGADPICTPHLFKYKFLKFLELQIREVMYTEKNKSLFDILEEGKGITGDDKSRKIAAWASSYFVDIVELGTKFKRLCLQKEKSEFAKSALNNLFFKLKNEADWFYVQNIFYLLAFGSKSAEPLIRSNLLRLHHHCPDIFKELNDILCTYFKDD